MILENDQQLNLTQLKLSKIEAQIDLARARAASKANHASIRSLVQMANQLREEIVRYHSLRERRAS